MTRRKNKKAFNFTGPLVQHIRHLHDVCGMKPKEIEEALHGIVDAKQIANQLNNTTPISTRPKYIDRACGTRWEHFRKKPPKWDFTEENLPVGRL